MAIIHHPSILFLDEPTPGLDAQSARAIRGLIRKMKAEGTTVFLTTHQIEEANQLCDRVAIIDHGQIAAIDTPERLKSAFQRVQSVEVALEPDGQAHVAPLSALPGVTTLVKMGDKWRLYAQDPSALLPLVMDYARERALRVVSLSTLGPSLEDVFLEITGSRWEPCATRQEGINPRDEDVGGEADDEEALEAVGRRTGPGLGRCRQGRAGLLSHPADDHVWLAFALFSLFFLLDQTQRAPRVGVPGCWP